MKSVTHRPTILLAGLILVLIGCGDDGTTSGTINGPNPNNATRNFGEVPMHNVAWIETFSGVSNAVGVEYFLYELTEEGRAQGDTLSVTFETETAAFQGTVQQLVAGNLQVEVVCAPNRPGPLEATLLVKGEVSGSEHRTKLQCKGVSDYAFLKRPNGTAYERCYEGDKLATHNGSAWTHYDIQTGELAAAGADGRCGKVKPSVALTADESDGGRRGVIAHSPAGDALVASDLGGGVYFKDKSGFRTLAPWPAPVHSVRVHAFRPDGRSLVLSAIKKDDSAATRPQANWVVYDLDTDTTTPLIPPSIAADVSAEATSATFAQDAKRLLWAYGYMGHYEMSFVDTDARTARPVFENAIDHLRSLGTRFVQSPLVIGSQTPLLTPDARRAVLVLDYFQGTDYWFKEGNVYVHDFSENATYAVAVLPDGKLITGDGWGFGNALAIADDGQSVSLNAYYSAGSGGGGVRLTFDLVVPKRLWKKL